jgi:hypothetical protein
LRENTLCAWLRQNTSQDGSKDQLRRHLANAGLSGTIDHPKGELCASAAVGRIDAIPL